MSVTLLHTVEQSFVSRKRNILRVLLRTLAGFTAFALVILAAKRVNATEVETAKREPSSIPSISLNQIPMCDFNCSANTETSNDLMACERAQQKCEFNAHMPLNTHRIGRN